MSNLSPSQFPDNLYHGTVHPLEGDTLTPGRKSGATTAGQDPWGYLGQSKNDYVSATDDEDKAWNFGYYARGQAVAHHVPPRVRVHVVEPNPETQIGIEHLDHPKLQEMYEKDAWRKPNPVGEHIAPSFKVKETLNIRPGQQGTFPEENWNKYSTTKADVNHPMDQHYRRPSRLRQFNVGVEMTRELNEGITKSQEVLF